MEIFDLKHNFEVHNNLGIAYGVLGKYKEATEAFKQAIRINPDDTDARLSLGIAYLSLNDRGSAVEQYKILKSLDPKLAKKLFSVINN